jgi:hypothetical protein
MVPSLDGSLGPCADGEHGKNKGAAPHPEKLPDADVARYTVQTVQ